MKLSDLEKQFNEFSRTQESQSLGNVDKSVQNKVWKKVQLNTPHKKRSIAPWAYAAASMILLIAAYSYVVILSKNKQITQLKNEIEQLELTKTNLQGKYIDVADALTLLQNQAPRIDTVYKTRIVYKEKEVFVDRMPQITEDDEQITKTERGISIGDEIIDLAKIGEDIASIKIECGRALKGRKTPWSFTVEYN